MLQFDGSTAADLSHRYLWGTAVDQLLADETVDDGGVEDVLWPLTDNLGTVRDLATYDDSTDTTTVANHKAYDAFGNVTSETNSAVDSLFGYTGRLFDDDTGLQNNLNRWYDPAVAQWVSEDPIGFAAGDANLSRYVGNNVTGAVDPWGLLDRTTFTRTGDGYEGGVFFNSTADYDYLKKHGVGGVRERIATLITGDPGDAKYVEMDKEKSAEKGVPYFDVSGALKQNEISFVNNLRDAFKAFNPASFGGTSTTAARPLTAAEIEEFFTGKGVTDCYSAGSIVWARAIVHTLGKWTVESEGVDPNTGERIKVEEEVFVFDQLYTLAHFRHDSQIQASRRNWAKKPGMPRALVLERQIRALIDYHDAVIQRLAYERFMQNPDARILARHKRDEATAGRKVAQALVPGDHLDIRNDTSYNTVKGRGTGWVTENVTFTGDSLWGFPYGEKNYEQWLDKLVEGFNKGLAANDPKRITITDLRSVNASHGTAQQSGEGFTPNIFRLNLAAIWEHAFDFKANKKDHPYSVKWRYTPKNCR